MATPTPSRPSPTSAAYQRALIKGAEPSFYRDVAPYYPPPSYTRQLAAAGATGQPAPLPRARIFPWIMNMTGTSRRTLSTPRIYGPALIRRLFFGRGTVTTPVGQTLEVGWAPAPVQEAGVALSTPRAYTVLTEKLDPFGVAGDIIGQGIYNDNSINSQIQFEINLNFIITEAQFFAVIAWVNNTASAEQRGGHLEVIESVDATALAAFLG